MTQNQNLLEEERLEPPFDPNRVCSINIWTTCGVKKKLQERGAKVGKSLSGYTKELVESAANGFASEPGAEMYEAELERQAVENNALRTENNELKDKVAAKDKMILQLNSERRNAPKSKANKPKGKLALFLTTMPFMKNSPAGNILTTLPTFITLTKRIELKELTTC